MIASLRGGSGKTIVSMGILAAWKARGQRVVPFKKGPDYIDAGWLAMAADHPCFNLDPFLMGKAQVLQSFRRRSEAGVLALIEGNRGLFDGINPKGTYSSAELAKTLKCPLVLIVDCTKTTRTAAAMVLGCRSFDPDLDLKGIILNNLAGARHEQVIRKSIQRYTGLPVLGAMPRMPSSNFPERHLGLLPFQEHPEVEKALSSVRQIAEKYLDLEGLSNLARQAPELSPLYKPMIRQKKTISSKSQPVIGVIQDQAFQFYYPENIESLERSGAQVVYLDALSGNFPQTLDGLYVGGGFPETQALRLTENQKFRRALKKAIEKGLPVYAECGGLMYLGRELRYQGKVYPMVGVLPLSFVLEKRPQGHGYTQLKVLGENPFFPVGKSLKGHEFHYSKVVNWPDTPFTPAFKMIKGAGLDGAGDGIVYKNVLASYTHLHALGTAEWGAAMVRKAREYKLSATR
ncbi:MAG: cobyrinate a,c-diamide synthase [Thermodesulfobacteriota bacterium]